MKLHILANDELLFNYLKKQPEFEEVQFVDKLNSNYPYDVLLISDDLLSFGELSQYDFLPESKVFFMTQNQMSLAHDRKVKAFCDGKGIHSIPPRLTVEQITDFITSVIEPKEEIVNNVVTFFSSISNIGTTSTCLSVASALNKISNAKIGVLLINAWDDGSDFMSYKGQYLNEVHSRLTAKVFQNNDDFLSNFHEVKKDSLYILAGNRDTKKERLFTIEEIYYLIEQSKKVFDIILIDSGSHFDNANMVQALKESDLRFLVLNQQEKSRRKFNQIFQDVLSPVGYSHEDFMLIINQFEQKTHYPTTKEIHGEVQVPMITAVPKSKSGINAEIERKTLYNFDDVAYQEAINIIAKSIASFTNLNLIEEGLNKKKKKVFGLL
ncbi:hypothetical protein KM915_20845 [Cytobacillus oceanisediminis]|uniref:hypothetical protein n=1 Tax=Cytobacillus oceanisediminis TaxID=665099 RepID=UPI001C213F53|nr:hypothetical protein [Cytobacillus oceanisediminis]MBU8732499.1 hypothetical protein [Cytobacillus oceanisediminis]